LVIQYSPDLRAKRRYLNKIIYFFGLFLLCLLVNFVSADSQTDKLVEQRTKELDGIIAQQNNKIQEKQNQAKSLKDEIANIEQQSKAVEIKIKTLNEKLRDAQGRLDYIENEVKLNEKKLDHEQEKLKKGIKLIYAQGNTDIVEILASSETLSSAVNQSKYLLTISEDLAVSVENIKDIKNNLNKKKQEIEKEKNEQESIKGEQERCKEELATRIMAKNRLIDETKGDEELYKKILKQALNDKSQVSSMISAISSGASPISIGLPFSGARAGQRVYTGEPIARLGNTGFSSGPHVHFGVYQYGRDIDPMPLLSVNAFSFPVPGAKITQDFFGSYSHRGRGWPGGIDFAAAEGTPVRAAKNGVIIFDGVGKNGISSGFGHYIIIDHQNGFLTLYGHLK